MDKHIIILKKYVKLFLSYSNTSEDKHAPKYVASLTYPAIFITISKLTK